MTADNLPIVNGIRRRLGVRARGTGIGDGCELQSCQLNISILTVGNYQLLCSLKDRPNRLRWDDGGNTGLLILQGDLENIAHVLSRRGNNPMNTTEVHW